MKCPSCQFENRDGAKFCLKCGEKLELRCPKCDKSLPTEALFCDECGHNLTLPSEPPPKELSFDEKLAKIQRYLPKGVTEKILSQRDKIEGERKQVTVMFADMEGFTGLSERLGPEEAYSIMDQVYEILIHKVHDYEGTVNEMTGDGIMALFGAPIALEDAPQRAIRSAYAIHREMTKFSDKMKQERERVPPIKMRIGIHTGPVIVGTLGNDLRVEFKAVGDTVNLASRMEEIAEPGATYVTEDTFKHTEGLFVFEALGERRIKGKQEPIKAYRVIGPSGRRTRFDVSAERGLTPFVGRERELEILLDGFERVKSGRGQAFSIVAEAGVGKSRLLYEFRKAIANEDVTFLEGKCLSYSRNVAYHPILDTLKSNFDIREGDGDSEIREKVKRGLKTVGANEASTLPYVLELLSVKDSGIDDIPMSQEARKDRIIEALNRNVLKGSDIRPVVMAIEDLHWIDKSSEERFKSLLDNISGARVFLIFTYRPEFVHTWGGRSYHSQANLNRLSNRESLTMLSQILGTEDIDKDLEEFILEKTEGVPFFIEEFVKSLTEQGVVRKRENRYRLAKEIKDVIIPSTVQDVIMARIDSLAEGPKGVLQTGAVIGREFNQDLIQMVTKLPERDLLSHLSVLKDSELLYERGIYPQSSYIFKHALTQEVAYNSLLSKRRKAIHEKIGRAIEELHSERLDEFCEMLAYHYSRADNYERAYQYLKASGQKASRKYSYWEALNFYREAMNMLNQFPESGEKRREQIDIRLLMSIAMYPLGYPEDSIRILQQGEKLARDLGDERSIAKFLSNIGHCYGAKGKPLLAIERHENCLQLAKKIKDFDLTIQAAGELCMSYSRAGELFKITEVAPGVIDQLERKKRESGLGVVESVSYSRLCSFYGLSLGFLGNFEDGRDYCEKSILTGIEVDDILRLAAWEWHYGWFLIAKGGWKLAIEHFQKSIKHGEDTKHTMILGWAWSSLGYAHYCLGDVEAARNHAEKGIRIQTDASIALWSEVHYLVLGLIYLDLGELRKAQSYTEEALELSRKAENGFLEGLSWIALGRMLGEVDPLQNERAEEAFVKGIKILNELKLRPFQGTGYFFLGELCADTAQKEKALENLKKAESMFQEMGMDYWLARTYAVYADLYKKEGDQSRAKEQLEKAIGILRDLSADGWVKKYEAELGALS